MPRECSNTPGLGRKVSSDMEYSSKVLASFWDKVVIKEGCWDWRGSKTMGYGKIGHKRGTVYAHRFSYEIHRGPIPSGMAVDHLCFTRGCANPDHLRLTSYKQNKEHRQGPGKDNTSGHLGVSWRSDIQKWKGTVKHNGKSYHLGFFTDVDEAAEVVRAKRNELFTHNDMDRRAA